MSRWSALVLSLFALACTPVTPLGDADGGVMDGDPQDADADTAADGEPSSITNLATGLVMTSAGPIQGVIEDGVGVYRGIPFAAPPVDELRWRAPVKPATWAEARRATTFGPMCPQRTSDIPLPHLDEIPQSEDCLTLNLWTTATETDERRPVMVWIHGGGFSIGTGRYPLYDGTRLATEQDVIVVTFNYRLGPLGWLAHRSLTAESDAGASGNYGFMDQIAALEWVRDNIADFGGDPDNVTVFGESAGGYSVCLHLASSKSTGLFHRAIVESASCPKVTRHRTLDTRRWTSAESVGPRLEEALGCDADADPVACMRQASVENVVNALPTCTSLFNCDHGEKWVPIIDGSTIVEGIGHSIEGGSHNVVPVIGGVNADEATFFRQTFAEFDTVTEYEAWVRTLFGAFAPRVFQYFPVEADEEANDAVSRIFTELGFICPTRAYALDLALHADTYVYLFSHTSAPAAQSGLGAYHGAEVPFVFHQLNPASGYDTTDDSLAAQVSEYWARFARTGDPNGGELPRWPRFDADAEAYLRIASPIASDTELSKAVCEAFSILY